MKKQNVVKEVDDLRNELKRVREENELLALKAELAKTKKENKRLAKQVLTDDVACEVKENIVGDAPSQVRQCYIGGLPYAENEDSICKYFEKECGSVISVKLQMDNMNRFTGIAFVEFADDQGLEAALALDGLPFTPQPERILKVRIDKNVKRRPPPSREANSLTVYAGNLPFNMSKEQIRHLFESQLNASIVSIRYHTDANSGEFRGFCHIELTDESSLQRAVQADGIAVHGRQLRITHSTTGKKRSKM
uniref:RRM domain-containing protein n=1 Tax=Aureoumbra lagunensis TaxID=44058 RepID=A0A7S3NKN1_9STRA|mmetsp:Transcript_22397/g.28998  ORF Transcript_22397/g.28998 Transcript_22397/m.28998 type:complete len:250 (+) Transcript_22397:80-829(+)